MEYIKSWGLALLTALGFVQPQKDVSLPPVAEKTRISIVKGDITQQNVDVIVNAANEDLSHGGGVALAISRAAGPELQTYCNTMPLVDGKSRCPMGQAVITPAFNLEKMGIKKIIHTTGPRGATPGKESFLRNCYYNSLELARENGLRSVAFPSISTAIFGYDIKDAAPIALTTVKEYVTGLPQIAESSLQI